ncbi:ABA4-like family protein [soil metagenome]
MRAATRWAPWHRSAWTVLNASTMPVWLLMILLPRRESQRTLVEASMPLHAVLGVTYAGLLAKGATRGGDRVDFRDGESVARGLSSPEGMLAGWTHYLTFDLFVGAWIWRTALEEGIDARLALLGTWWLGPVGLTLFQWQRRRARR